MGNTGFYEWFCSLYAQLSSQPSEEIRKGILDGIDGLIQAEQDHDAMRLYHSMSRRVSSGKSNFPPEIEHTLQTIIDDSGYHQTEALLAMQEHTKMIQAAAGEQLESYFHSLGQQLQQLFGLSARLIRGNDDSLRTAGKRLKVIVENINLLRQLVGAHYVMDDDLNGTVQRAYDFLASDGDFRMPNDENVWEKILQRRREHPEKDPFMDLNLPEHPINLRYSPSGVITFILNAMWNSQQADASFIEVGVELHDLDDARSHAVLYVQDDGPGIPPELRKRVVEWGYTTRDKGTGKGMYVMSMIARLHDGEMRIRYADELGKKGTRIELLLPYHHT